MNKKVDLNDLKIFNSPDDLAEYHYFPKILKRSLEFDLAVHKNLFKDKPHITCLLYTSPSPRDDELSRMPSSA